MVKYLTIPVADGDNLAQAKIHSSAQLSGLQNGTAYRCYLLSEPSDAFTPAAPAVSRYLGFGGAYPANYALGNSSGVSQFGNTVVTLTAKTALETPQLLCPNGKTTALRIGAMTLEYPAGSFHAVTFSGGGAVTIAGRVSVGTEAYALSDTVAVTIPAGATFKIRTYMIYDSASGVSPAYTTIPAAATAAGYTWSASGTDQTQNAGFSGTSGAAYCPFVLAQIPLAVPSVQLLGDSIMLGQGDTADSLLRRGSVQKSLPISLAHVNCGVGGTNFSSYAGYDFYAVLTRYASHVVCNYGTNQTYMTGTSAASWLSSAQAFWGRADFAGKRRVQVTLIPRTTSSDGWLSEAGQSVYRSAPFLGYGDINAYVLAHGCGADDHFDTASAICGTDANKFYAQGTAMTADGTHPNQAGYDRIAASGAVVLAKLGA